jgi:hypothetical protein
MGLNHAVEHGFHGAARNPVVVKLPPGVFDERCGLRAAP